jgi:hypothetical protein
MTDLEEEMQTVREEISKLKRANEILTKALEFYGGKTTYKTVTVWTGSRGAFLSHDEEGLHPVDEMPVIEKDKGKRARKALKEIKGLNNEKTL